MAHEIKNILCVCGGGGGGGGGEGVVMIHLFQTALKNLANKYFHFAQFLILSSVGVVASPTNELGFESHQ